MRTPAIGLTEELQSLAKALQADLPIAELEKLEADFKSVVRNLAEGYRSDPSSAFSVAKAQKEMGLLRKYKSYGIKACSPLGYAIFLLNHDEGFSFQNHLTGKVELFHFLEVPEGGYAFVSSEDGWKLAYEKKKVKKWSDGKKDPAYDRFKIPVRVGDIVKIDKPGIVHTAVGCVLEEYATASTDMVERLHDQNAGKPIPKKFSKAFVRRALDKMEFPESSSLVSVEDLSKRSLIRPKKVEFGEETTLHDSKQFVAARYQVGASKSQTVVPGKRYVSLYFTEGQGTVSFVDSSGKQGREFTIAVSKGDPILFIPGTKWIIENFSNISLQYSFLSVEKSCALK